MDIFTNLGTIVSSVGEAFVSAATTITEIFYKAGEGGGITFIGYLALAGLGVSIVNWGVSIVMNFMKVRASRK